MKNSHLGDNQASLRNMVSLREVQNSDLPIFFTQQLDPLANFMAAFTAKDPTDRQAFDDHWTRILGDVNIILRTILYDDLVAGSILCHSWGGEPEISYWIGKDFWGKGIATLGLELFLGVVKVRPLYARVAIDNIASIRVLEKNGFSLSGQGKWYSNARQKEIDELIWVLK